METLFIRLVNLSISAGWLILAVLLLRRLLRGAPKWISCLLWGLVGLRLLLPFSLESVFSLVPSAETIPETIMTEASPAIDSGINIIDYSVNPIISGSLAPNPGDSANPLQVLTFAASVIWICGVAAMLLYLAGSYFLLRRKVRTATLLQDNIRQSEFVDSPFILGIIKPQIYIPYRLDEKALSHVLAHENAHLARRDYLIKPIAYIILSVYWFQPLVWISYILLCRDIELACDERVVRNLDAGQRKAYSLTLLACSTGRRRIAACPLAFGEVGIKERVMRVKAYKKPAFWIVATALIACGIAALCFLTDPKSLPAQKSVMQHDNTLALYKWRTRYIGDNSCVGNLIGHLTFPDDMEYQYFALQTDTEPYGVTVFFNIPAADREQYSEQQENPEKNLLRENACTLFALIENAGTVSFELSDGIQEPLTLTFDREWAESVARNQTTDISGTGLWEETETAEKLDALLTRIHRQVQDTRPEASTTVITTLEDAITQAILEHNAPKSASFADFICCSFVPLAESSARDSSVSFAEASSTPAEENEAHTITVYGWSLYKEYLITETELYTIQEVHVPLALTFEAKDNSYTLLEYWLPGDGAYFVRDVRAKFPSYAVEDGLDSQKFIRLQEQECRARAVEQNHLDADTYVEALITEICSPHSSNPGISSNPQDYLATYHHQEYQELLEYGNYTLQYCLERFEKGDETGLEGHIMARACEELLGTRDKIPVNAETASTGQEWYITLKAHGSNLIEPYVEIR